MGKHHDCCTVCRDKALDDGHEIAMTGVENTLTSLEKYSDIDKHTVGVIRNILNLKRDE